MILDRSIRASRAGSPLTVLLMMPALVLACSSEQPDESSAATDESSLTESIATMRRNGDGTYEVTCRDGRVEHNVSVAAVKAGDVCNADSCASYTMCGTCAAASDCKWCDGACAELGASCTRTAVTPSECSGGGSTVGSSGGWTECTPAERTDRYVCKRDCGKRELYVDAYRACSAADAEAQLARYIASYKLNCTISDCHLE